MEQGEHFVLYLRNSFKCLESISRKITKYCEGKTIAAAQRAFQCYSESIIFPSFVWTRNALGMSPIAVNKPLQFNYRVLPIFFRNKNEGQAHVVIPRFRSNYYVCATYASRSVCIYR